ncbi:methylated-DNA--[protein]-cysteine S-methyltransferase [Pararhodobacter sp. CCB-MM2]|uniref:methylated-DNA--[protein]-cysteine S-methyltransferase n=1 Tax=Pararhodobacter sp. CCB-MM2 TaxID=1786003 RepID=UPI000834AE54|nr:methylated-DNA--[protein]-cysteine S-methyltransferase [Pararhodobacter sp. CCB-MM2]MCA2013354.1 methylated-DNA--[protein]-cysteine S-methyltransferase [Cereibacter sphaeroides]
MSVQAEPLSTAPAGAVAGLTLGTPTGAFTLLEKDGVLTGARWGGAVLDDETPLLTEAAHQVEAYFDGRLEVFDLPLRIEASRAQQMACAAMLAIPMGETRTYGQLAAELKVSAQAMGQLCGNNPIPLIVPCHRVLGASGLGGFSAPEGVETKVWLLKHERAGGLLI